MNIWKYFQAIKISFPLEASSAIFDLRILLQQTNIW
jgi:hypothetical protein